MTYLEENKDKLGGYNAAPPGFRELTMEEFAAYDPFTYKPEFTEYRQIDPKTTTVPLPWVYSIFLNWLHDGTGWAIACEGKRVRFFRFEICAHVPGKDEGTAMFYHRFTCQKCGYRWGYDSSG